MHLFWARGFGGSSLQAIDEATGLHRGSVYNTFGDKQHLYLEALDFYGDSEFGAAARSVAAGGPAHVAIPALFDTAVAAIETADDPRRGCFVCSASTERAPVDPEVAARVNRYLDVLRQAFVGVLNASENTATRAAAEDIADHLVATYMGLQVLAKAGAPVARLRRVATQVRALFEPC